MRLSMKKRWERHLTVLNHRSMDTFSNNWFQLPLGYKSRNWESSNDSNQVFLKPAHSLNKKTHSNVLALQIYLSLNVTPKEYSIGLPTTHTGLIIIRLEKGKKAEKVRITVSIPGGKIASQLATESLSNSFLNFCSFWVYWYSTGIRSRMVRKIIRCC